MIESKMIKYIVLSLFTLTLSSAYAMEADFEEGTSLETRTAPYAGLHLRTPYVRVPMDSTPSRKLVLGGGHITEVEALNPLFRPGGGQELLTDLSGRYEFQAYGGWYAVSAEMDPTFGSDMVLDLRKPAHQGVLFSSGRWDIVFDATFTPSVFAAPGLIENICRGLRVGGSYIASLPITEERSAFYPGHEVVPDDPTSVYFASKLAFKGLDQGERSAEFSKYKGLRFDSLEGVEAYVRDNMMHLGFAAVNLHEHPLCKILQQSAKLGAKEDSLPRVSSCDTPAGQIDPLFRTIGLGTHYIIATK